MGTVPVLPARVGYLRVGEWARGVPIMRYPPLCDISINITLVFLAHSPALGRSRLASQRSPRSAPSPEPLRTRPPRYLHGRVDRPTNTLPPRRGHRASVESLLTPGTIYWRASATPRRLAFEVVEAPIVKAGNSMHPDYIRGEQ